MERHQILYINGRFLTQKITGVQRFGIEILKALSEEKEKDITILVPKNYTSSPLDHLYQIKKIGTLEGHLWEQIHLPLFLMSKKNPILLNLTNTAPLFYIKNIVTIHDLAFYVNPSWFSSSFRNYYNFLIPRIARKALKIITVSHTMKEQLASIFKIDINKIEVIYNAVPLSFDKKFNTQVSVEKKHYILTVGSIDPRKNLIKVLEAFNAAQIPNLQLYIIGDKNKNFNFNEELKDSRNIKFLGRVTDEDLLYYYSNSMFFVYLSLYEGFGIPNIEAMKLKVPVLTSNLPVMKEVCRDAAEFADPEKVEDIKTKIITLYKDQNLRERLAIQGYENQKRFSWKDSSKALLAIVEKHL